MNVPNALTLLRVLFAVAVFFCIAVYRFDFALVFFVLASLTDFLDGWWARKFKQITVFGRIMDPFADKFLICGTFICLVPIPELMRIDDSILPAWTSLQPWMVIVIVGRELLITSLRAVVESSGGDFSAKWIGKWKMGLQCAAVIFCFLYLSGKTGVFYWMITSLWATVIITIYSGVSYCVNAVRMMRGNRSTG